MATDKRKMRLTTQDLISFEKDFISRYENKEISKQDFQEKLRLLLHKISQLDKKSIKRVSEFFWICDSLLRCSHYLYSEFDEVVPVSIPRLVDFSELIDDVTPQSRPHHGLEGELPEVGYQGDLSGGIPNYIKKFVFEQFKDISASSNKSLEEIKEHIMEQGKEMKKGLKRHERIMKYHDEKVERHHKAQYTAILDSTGNPYKLSAV